MSATRITCIAIVILAGIATAGCSSVEIRKERQRIAIATDIFFLLPAHLESRPGKITIVALGALGGALFSISYDGEELQASGSVEAQVINSEYVLADVLLAHWDVDWLNQHLQGASIEVAEGGESRFLSRQDELVIGINYDTADPWGGKATLTHLERGYVLDIRTVEHISQ